MDWLLEAIDHINHADRIAYTLYLPVLLAIAIPLAILLIVLLKRVEKY